MNKLKLSKFALLVSILILTLLNPNISSAHSELVKSTPEQGTEVSGSIATMTLEFGAAVEEFVNLTLTDIKGNTYALEDPVIKEKNVVLMTKKPLPKGQYKLYWHLVGIDTHEVHGYLTFGVDEPAPSPSDIKASNEGTDEDHSAAKTSNPDHQDQSPTLYIVMIIIFSVIVIIGLVFAFRRKKE